MQRTNFGTIFCCFVHVSFNSTLHLRHAIQDAYRWCVCVCVCASSRITRARMCVCVSSVRWPILFIMPHVRHKYAFAGMVAIMCAVVVTPRDDKVLAARARYLVGRVVTANARCVSPESTSHPKTHSKTKLNYTRYVCILHRHATDITVMLAGFFVVCGRV